MKHDTNTTEHDNNTEALRRELTLISCWLDEFAKDDNDGAYLCFLRVLEQLRSCQAEILQNAIEREEKK